MAGGSEKNQSLISMKIGIIGSMQFSDKMIEAADELRKLGHEPVLSLFIQSFIGQNPDEQERIKLEQKNNEDAMRRDVEHLEEVDAILVFNIEKHGLTGYIGGNTFLEIGMMHLKRKPIYLLNPIPDIPYYQTEIEAMKPVVINGHLEKIK